MREVRKLFKFAQKIKLGIFWGTFLGLAIVSPVKISTGTENLSQTLVQIIPKNSQVEQIATGFKFTEGPLWHPDGYLLFSDIPANTIYQWQPDSEAQIFRRPSGKANGNTLDLAGRLISAEHENRRVSRTETDGTIVTLVDHYQGKKLNSPNDLVVKSDGSIYFTDPHPMEFKQHRKN
ncbi:MAG: hypothetical protein Kow0049_12320 [Stanieria sp.]